MSDNATTVGAEAAPETAQGAVKAPIVTDLLQALGLSGEGSATAVAAPSTDQDKLDERKLALKTRFQTGYQKDPAEAGAARRDTLAKLRTQFANTIGGKADTGQLDTAASILDRMDAQMAWEGNAEAKVLLKEDFTPDNLAGTPKGTGSVRAGMLEKLRMQFSNQLGGVPTDERLDAIREAHRVLKEEHGAAKDDVTKLDQARTEAARRLGELVKPGAAPGDVAPGATADDTAAAIEKVAEVLKLIEAADCDSITTAEAGVTAVGKLVETARMAVQDRAGKRDGLVQAARDVAVPKDAEPGEKEAFESLRGKVAMAMEAAPLTDAAVMAGGEALDALKTERTRLEGVVLTRQKRHDTLTVELGKVENPVGLPDQVERLHMARGKVDEALKLPLGDDANDKASDALDALKKDVLAVKDELDSLGGLDGVDALCKAVGLKPEAYAGLETAFGGRAKMGPLLKAFPPKELGGLVGALGGGDGGVTAVAGLLGTYDPAGLKILATNLGGTANLGGLVKEGLDGTGIKRLGDTLGGTKTVGALMAGGDPAKPVALGKALGDTPKALSDFIAATGLNGKPQAVVELFLRGCKGDPQKFVALTAALKGKDAGPKFKALTQGGGLGDQPAILGEMLDKGCGGDPANLLKLGEAFADKGNEAACGKLKALVKDGGLAAAQPPGTGADPGCLAALLQFGAKDPKDFDAKVASFKALATVVPPGSLKNLVSGLGQQPEVLGHLVGVGCEGNGGQVKVLGDKLAGQPAQDALGKLVGDGGLAPSTRKVAGKPDEVVVDPACLGHLLQSGAKNADAATFAQKADALVALAKGLGDKGRADLKGLLADGGLGREPEIFSHLVSAGCDGDSVKVNGLTAGLSDGAARTGLAATLRDGGLARRDVAPAAAADPRCLAALFETGCNGDPTVLKALVTSLSEAQRKEVATVVGTGSLGKHPEVLGNLYRFGCLADPANDASAQSPAALVRFAHGLQGKEAKLKGLLDDGGFGDKNYPRVLGQIVRDAFNGGPGTGAMSRDPSRLADLYDTFATSTKANVTQKAAENKTELAKLKTMMTAFSTYPAEVSANRENPGRALDNIVFKAKLPLGQLKAQFYEGLDTHSRNAGFVANDAHLSASYGVGKLNRTELLQNAGTFQNFAPGPQRPGNLPSSAWTCDTNHINWRHTRNHLNLDGSGLDPNKVTTLFREGVGSGEVATMIEDSINNLGGAGLPDDDEFYNRNLTWITRNSSTGGVSVKMGVQHFHDWQDGSGNWIENSFDMNQWYPHQGSPGTKTILYGDMNAMVRAVRT